MKDRFLFICLCVITGFFCFSCCMLSVQKIYTLDSANCTVTPNTSEKDFKRRFLHKKQNIPPNIKKVNTNGGYFNTTFLQIGSKNSVRIMQNKEVRTEVFTSSFWSNPLATGFIFPTIPVKFLAKNSPLRSVYKTDVCHIKISTVKGNPIELLSGEFGGTDKVFITQKTYPDFTKQDSPVHVTNIRRIISEESFIWIEFPLAKTFSLKLLIDGSEYNLTFKQATVWSVWVVTV